MLNVRLRLASLWVSQVARVLADWCLRIVALLAWSGAAHENGLLAGNTATVLGASNPVTHLSIMLGN